MAEIKMLEHVKAQAHTYGPLELKIDPLSWGG